jgi:hypothetical protein
MATKRRMLGHENPDMLTSLANLASIFLKQGQWKEAEDLEVQMIEMSRRVS